MELDENGFLEELLSMRRESNWDAFSAAAAAAATAGIGEFFAGEGGLDCLMHESQSFAAAATFDGNCSGRCTQAPPVGSATEPNFDCLSEVWFSPPAAPAAEEGVLEVGLGNGEESNACKVEMGFLQLEDPTAFGAAVCGGERTKKKKADGVPSKNLMAERRRRKRLNDRLSMLRSVVPKISKMDRTSILGDTIDYMKELLERIKHLQQDMDVGSGQSNVVSLFKDQLNPNEILVRNSPKFDVERRESDTRIEIFCAMKPGLLLQMVDTLDALGLEIQQCVVSCFNDFGMQASCSEDMEQRSLMTSEEIKQALFKNAGYGGRCL